MKPTVKYINPISQTYKLYVWFKLSSQQRHIAMDIVLFPKYINT